MTYYTNEPVTQITGTVRVDNFGQTVPVTGNVTSASPLARTATVLSFQDPSGSFLLAATNPSRKQLWVYVTGSDIFVGPPEVTTGSFFLKVESGGLWELPTQGGVYVGELWGVLSGVTGSVQVTEVR